MERIIDEKSSKGNIYSILRAKRQIGKLGFPPLKGGDDYDRFRDAFPDDCVWTPDRIHHQYT